MKARPKKKKKKAGPLSDPMLVGKSKSGNYFPKQAPGYFRCSFGPGRKSFYPSRECVYHDQQVMVVSVRFHFSEIHFQMFKGQRAFYLNPWRFLSVLRGNINL